MRSHRLVAPLAAMAIVGLLAGTPAASATTTSPCRVSWGSVARSEPAMTPAPILNARVGRHECFDRLVIDIEGPAGGYDIRYTDGFRNSASGEPIPVAGGAVLTVAVHAPEYDVNTGSPTVPWREGTLVAASQLASGGFRTFRDLVAGVSFEGVSDFGLGVRARLPFRVFKLDGPGTHSRIVVDVAHRW